MSDRVVVIIQARMGSSRLPGKVLLDVGGKPMIDRVVERARAIGGVDEVVVATSTLPGDDVLAEHVRNRTKAPVFRGSENDVLARYMGAAREARADVIIRITSDCPLLCPDVSGRVLDALLSAGRERADYASNTQRRTWARGLDTEAVWFDVLERADIEATSTGDREHVTPFIWSQPDRFRLVSVEQDVDESYHRWTVDTPEDLELARRIYQALEPDDAFGLDAIRTVLERHPDWVELNREIVQKAVVR